jgi:DNA-binding NarL/FixJ family response regulator
MKGLQALTSRIGECSLAIFILVTVPYVVLMDIDMPVMDGIDAIIEGKVRFPFKIHLHTVFVEDDKIFNAINTRANDYL